MKAKHIVSIISLFFCIAVSAQFNNVGYYMGNLPQNHLMNPAFQPTCGVHFGLFAAPFSFKLENSSVSIGNMFINKSYANGTDSIIFPLIHADATAEEKDEFLSNFKDVSYINNEIYMGLLTFGFRKDNSYFTFGAAIRGENRIDYPKDLVKLIANGVEEGTYDLSGFGMEFNWYKEFYIGYTQAVSDKMVTGAKFKLLSGIANAQVVKQDIQFEASPFEYRIKSDFEFRTSTPGGLLNYETSGINDLESIELNDSVGQESLMDDLTKFKNLGFAIDYGIDYEFNKEISVSASVLDLGFISWSRNANVVKSNAEFSFNGVSVDGLDLFDSTSVIFQQIQDSLSNSIAATSDAVPYTSFLTAKLIIGGKYTLNDKINFGLMTRTEIYRNKLFPQITLSANFSPLKWLDASLGYSLLNQEFYNIGAGLAFHAGPLNIYFLTDSGPLVYTKYDGIPLPYHAKGFRFQFGINFVFNCCKGCNEDIPLLDEY